MLTFCVIFSGSQIRDAIESKFYSANAAIVILRRIACSERNFIL